MEDVGALLLSLNTVFRWLQDVAKSLDTPRQTAPAVVFWGTYSKEADTFSFAMVMVEVCHHWSIVCRTLADCRFMSI